MRFRSRREAGPAGDYGCGLAKKFDLNAVWKKHEALTATFLSTADFSRI